MLLCRIVNLLSSPVRQSLYHMITMSSSVPKDKGPFVLPSTVRGMKWLDVDAFTLDVSIAGIKVPAGDVAAVSKRLKSKLLKIPRLKPIAELADSDRDRSTHKLFLFNPTLICSAESFDESDREFLSRHSVNLDTCRQYAVMLTYENWTYDEVLDAVLPEGQEGVGGFSVIGHIAHLNLKDHLLEYKNLIGKFYQLSDVKLVALLVMASHLRAYFFVTGSGSSPNEHASDHSVPAGILNSMAFRTPC